jgi:hypothetical protein
LTQRWPLPRVHPPMSKYGGVTQPQVFPLLLLPGCGGEEALLPTCVLLHVRRSTTRITALYIEGYGERPAAKP